MMSITGNWLKKAGHEVITASSGKEALALAKEGADLVILDVAMPEMDGPAVFRELREMEEARDIPVIFRTGMEEEGAMESIRALNPAGVAPKSEGKSTLMEEVKKALSV